MGFPCDCITVIYDIGAGVQSLDLSALGVYNGRNYYEYTDGVATYTMFWNGVDAWEVTSDGLGGSALVADLEYNVDCPDIDDWKFSAPVLSFRVDARDCCAPKQERIEEFFSSVKLPEVFEEQDRGFFRCCCPFNVLASDGPTWENDITSAWIKLSSLSDTTSAVLLKHGQPTAYTPTIQSFPNDANAYYWTINWNDVLLSDGVGCYSLQINYNISGVSGDFTWGIYNLLPFTIQNALKTARLRVKFNSYQEIEGINFTGANVEDTIRFHGFIGFRQPNMEIDNLIYKNREVKKVKRENLNTYEVITDPTCEEHIKKLTDLYLLSENELFISDYNAHNHSYRYQDLPAVVEESPEITYFDFARSASLKCIVGDKKKDKRSFYNGGLNLLSGPTGGQVCAPASYVVEYATAGPIQSGTIPSGGSETIVVPDPGACADGTVENSNASYTDSVVSGGTLVLPDITVTDSDGSTYTQPSVENVVCTLSPDTSLEVNGTPEGTFVAGSTIEVNVTDGVNPVTPDNVTVVGDVVTIEVPSGGGGGWVRPSDWLTMPTLTSADEDIAILHAVWNNDSNYAAFRCTTSAGDYDVDWGDGTTTSHASNTTAEHQYDYATYDTGNATLSTRGYKQAIIRITPATGTLATFSSNFRYTGQNQVYSTGFLDVLLSMPSATSGASISFASTLVSHRYMEQVHILNSGGITNALNMFIGCTSLQSVPLFDTSSVTVAQSMFNGCTSLQSVPLFDTSNNTTMSNMFQGCTLLQSVPLLNTSSVANMTSAFNGCVSLQTVPLFDTSSVTTMSGMLQNCSLLQSVPLFNTSNVANMQQMLQVCTSLQTVPLFDTSSVTTMQQMFFNCLSLQEIPAFTTTNVTNMTNFATNCNSMSKTNIVCRVSVNFSNNQLSQAELVNIFNNLLDRTLLASANINITGNYGAAALTVPERAIATLKNWTITG